MKQLHLTPTDTLFFRDGRPMEGSLAGESLAWPLPHTINAALHAALWRAWPEADSESEHCHRFARGTGRERVTDDNRRNQRFGSLQSIGPFPVVNGQWYIPVPADLDYADQPGDSQDGSVAITHLPCPQSNVSSLPAPLNYVVGSTRPPSKDSFGDQWMMAGAVADYCDNKLLQAAGKESVFLNDSDIADREEQIGIGIDPESGVAGQNQAEGQIYAASYLRLRRNAELGVAATAPVKNQTGQDLISRILSEDQYIIVGGQQRVCSARIDSGNNPLPLPRGMTSFSSGPDGKCRLKWVLLSPAIYPPLDNHPGGWLPNWIDPRNGKVLLKQGDTTRRDRESRSAWRARVQSLEGFPAARLVAALSDKPITITGWSINPQIPEDTRQPGAKATQLAVPAGSIYYFETNSTAEAQQLAETLNWHDADGKPRNRRSTIGGEKGFGLGFCAPWTPHPHSQTLQSQS